MGSRHGLTDELINQFGLGYRSLVRYSFGFRLNLDNGKCLVIPENFEGLYHCNIGRSGSILDDCYQVPNPGDILTVSGCTIQMRLTEKGKAKNNFSTELQSFL